MSWQYHIVGNPRVDHLVTYILILLATLGYRGWQYHSCWWYRVISGPEYRWALKMGQRAISHSFTYKNQDFDGPFCIFMGLLEKMMGPRILNRHLTAKLTSHLNSLCLGPNQKLKQIKSISTSFLTKLLGPIPEISLWYWGILTLLHSEGPKLFWVLALLSAIGLRWMDSLLWEAICQFHNFLSFSGGQLKWIRPFFPLRVDPI